MSEPVLPPGGVDRDLRQRQDGNHLQATDERPHTVTDGHRVRHLVYMYGHWVFVWAEAAKTVRIGFGTINSHTVEHKDVPITVPWGTENLVNFGRNWRKQLIGRVT